MMSWLCHGVYYLLYPQGVNLVSIRVVLGVRADQLPIYTLIQR